MPGQAFSESGAICDLHTHSVYSDGTATPEELVSQAENLGLCALALTDHNTAAGLPEFMKRGKTSSVEVIAGAEFSTEHQGREVHIVGLFLPEDACPKVDAWARALWESKDASNRKLEAALRASGYDVDYAELRNRTPNGQVNRALFASELEKKGCMTMEEAFATVLSSGNGLYVPPVRPDTYKTIEDIRNMGGVPVLAHPFLSLPEEEMDAFIARAREAGLGAVEVYYSTNTPAQTRKTMALAERYGLAVSGGSDYHGSRKPDISLGTGKGDLRVPCSVLETLRNA